MSYSVIILEFLSPNEVVNGKQVKHQFQSPYFQSTDSKGRRQACIDAWSLAAKSGYTRKEFISHRSRRVPPMPVV